MSRRIFVLSLEIWRHPRSIKIAKTLVRSGYKVKLWGIRKRFNKGPRLIRALLNYALALVEIAIIKADLYWVENVPDIIYIPLAIFRRKYVYDRRSPWYYSVKREIGGSFLPLIAKIFETVLMSKASYIVCASTSLAMEVEGLGKPVEVIPNYPEKKFSEYATRDVRKELGIPSQRKVLLYVGKLSRTEGVDILVDVAGAIKDLDAELWIVGDGPLRTVPRLRSFLVSVGRFITASGYAPSHPLLHANIHFSGILLGAGGLGDAPIHYHYNIVQSYL